MLKENKRSFITTEVQRFSEKEELELARDLAKQRANIQQLQHLTASEDQGELGKALENYMSARNYFAEANFGLAVKIARKACRIDPIGPRIPFQDLLQEAIVELLVVIDKFNPERGIKFSSFAYPSIYFHLLNYIKDFGTRGAKVNHRVQGKALQTDGPGFELKEAGTTVANLLNPQSFEELPVHIPSSDIKDPTFEKASNTLELERLFKAMRQLLTEREFTAIVESRLNEKSQRVIGEKLGVSQMQVRTIIKGGLKKLEPVYF